MFFRLDPRISVYRFWPFLTLFFWATQRPFWGQNEVVLGQFGHLDLFGVILRLLYDHFGIILVSFLCRFGVILRPLLALSVPFWPFWAVFGPFYHPKPVILGGFGVKNVLKP